MAIKKTAKKKPNKVLTRDGRVVRKLEQPDYKSFKLAKRIKHPGPKLSNSFRLTKLAILHIYRNKKIFGGISLTYLVLMLLLVRGFIFTGDIAIAKESITELLSGSTGQVAASLAVFGILLNSVTPTSEVATLYQSLLIIVFSLFIIWALRQTYAKEKITLKQVFYRSTHPLVQFIMVVLVIGLQVLPLLAASFLYSATISSGLSTSAAEFIAWYAVVFFLVLWSLYMISASLFAIYIVTLPDMTPIKALKSAKKLVQLRRWTVMRKVAFIPIVLFVASLVLLVPIIIFFTTISEIIFLFLSAFLLVFIHSYIYALYRELLD